MSTSNFLVLLAAVLCTCIAQMKSARKSTQRGFSFLGGLACAVVAVEGFMRDETGTVILFSCAAAVNLLIAAFNYPQPANDEQ